MNNTDCSDAEKVYAIGFMARAKKKNTDVRAVAGFKKNYEASHFMRMGKVLSEEELLIWHRNPQRISLGHARALARFKDPKQRLKLFEDLLVKRIPVQTLERMVKGVDTSKDVDVKRFERVVSESIGRPLDIKFNQNEKKGEITLTFFGWEDLDIIVEALGYKKEEEW